MANFDTEMRRAQIMKDTEPDRAEFWVGYMRGLRRSHHGEDFGEPGEHEKWLSLVDDIDENRRMRGAGYIAGLQMQSGMKGQPPKFAKTELVSFRLPQDDADRCPRNNRGNIDQDFLRLAIKNELDRADK